MVAMLRRMMSHLLQVEIWLVAFFVLTSMISARLLPITAVVIVTLLILRIFADHRSVNPTPAGLAIVILLVMAIISLLITALPGTTIIQVLRLFSGIGLYYAIVHWAKTKKHLRILLLISLAIGIALVGLSTFSVTWVTDKLRFIPAQLYDHLQVLVSDTINANVMAGSFVLIFPVAVSLLFSGWKSIKGFDRLLALLTSGLLAIGIVFTQTRGALVASGIAMLLLVILRMRYGWVMVVITAIISVVSLKFIDMSAVVNWLNNAILLKGAEGRMEIWSRAIYMIQDFPFTGIGMGSFQEVANRIYPFLNYSKGVPHAHNLLLQVAVDLGIPGLLAWLSTFFIVTFNAWLIYQKGRLTRQPLLCEVGAGFIASQTALLVHGMFDSVTWGLVRSAPLVWALWGVVVAWQLVFQVKQTTVNGFHD